MKAQIYEMNFDGRGLVEIDTSKNKDVSLGEVILWGGNMAWQPEEFVVVELVEGMYGTKLVLVSLEDKHFHYTNAYDVKRKDDPSVTHSQHMFFQDRQLNSEETKELHKEAVLLKTQAEQKQKDEAKAYELQVAKGKELFQKYAPDGTKSVIVANYETDESDSMTDYFATRTTKKIVLGFSKHHRDLFNEMRKHCHKYDKVKHLAVASQVDTNGEEKNDENKSWWTPSDEHREKWSMGKGYYLKSDRYRGGWEVCKEGLSNSVYASLAESCLFGGEQ